MKSPINRAIPTASRGSILIFVLWVLMLLSIFTLSVGYSVRQRLKAVERLETKEALRYVAEAGVKKAWDILNSKEIKSGPADTLNQPWSINFSAFKGVQVGDGNFTVMKYAYAQGKANYEEGLPQSYGMIDEESKLNLNQTQSPPVLAELIQRALRMETEMASTLAESIVDWIDADDHSYASGAESRFYRNLRNPYQPKNAFLNTLEELLLVKGMTPEILRALRSYVTVQSNGKINMNTVSHVVLNALGLNETLTAKVLSYRAGTDKQVGTRDDGIFTNINDISTDLEKAGLIDAGEKEVLDNFVYSTPIDISSQNFEVHSIGKLNHRKEALMIHCVIERQGGVRQWQETYVR